MYSFVLSFFFAYITKENKTFVRIYSKVITGTCDVSYMYRYADPIAGRHEAHLRKATRSGVKSARAKEQVNKIAEATQQSTKSGRLHLSYNYNKKVGSDKILFGPTKSRILSDKCLTKLQSISTALGFSYQNLVGLCLADAFDDLQVFLPESCRPLPHWCLWRPAGFSYQNLVSLCLADAFDG